MVWFEDTGKFYEKSVFMRKNFVQVLVLGEHFGGGFYKASRFFPANLFDLFTFSFNVYQIMHYLIFLAEKWTRMIINQYQKYLLKFLIFLVSCIFICVLEFLTYFYYLTICFIYWPQNL